MPNWNISTYDHSADKDLLLIDSLQNTVRILAFLRKYELDESDIEIISHDQLDKSKANFLFGTDSAVQCKKDCSDCKNRIKCSIER